MTDAKVEHIYRNHQQYGSVQLLAGRVESIRKRSTLYGAAVTTGALFVNEVSRFALRTPLFKLGPMNLFVILVGPMAFFKYGASDKIKEVVGKYYRIDRNRYETGIGASYRPNGEYKNLMQNNQMNGRIPMEVTWTELLCGEKLEFVPYTPGIRLNKTIEEYPQFWEDYDRDCFINKIDGSERLDKFKHNPDSYQNEWFVFGVEDTDQKVVWGGPEDDGPFIDPPDMHLGNVIDHGQDERSIWNFRRSIMNTDIISNQWSYDFDRATVNCGAPDWGSKLQLPGWAKPEKLTEYMHQMYARREFHFLQAKWLLNYSSMPTYGEKDEMKRQADDFIKNTYRDKLIRDLKDVYVTDHLPTAKRLHTNSSTEDEDFFNYEKKLNEFHVASPDVIIEKAEKSWEHPAYSSLMKAAIPVYIGNKFDYMIDSKHPNMSITAITEAVQNCFVEESEEAEEADGEEADGEAAGDEEDDE